MGGSGGGDGVCVSVCEREREKEGAGGGGGGSVSNYLTVREGLLRGGLREDRWKDVAVT